MKKNSRSKGQRGEREVIQLIKHLYPDAHRHLEFRKWEADEGKDIENTGMFDIQVKLGTHVPKKMYDFIEQILDINTQYQVVVSRKDKKRWLATMYFDDFLELLAIMKGNDIKI